MGSGASAPAGPTPEEILRGEREEQIAALEAELAAKKKGLKQADKDGEAT